MDVRSEAGRVVRIAESLGIENVMVVSDATYGRVVVVRGDTGGACVRVGEEPLAAASAEGMLRSFQVDEMLADVVVDPVMVGAWDRGEVAVPPASAAVFALAAWGGVSDREAQDMYVRVVRRARAGLRAAGTRRVRRNAMTAARPGMVADAVLRNPREAWAAVRDGAEAERMPISEFSRRVGRAICEQIGWVDASRVALGSNVFRDAMVHECWSAAAASAAERLRDNAVRGDGMRDHRRRIVWEVLAPAHLRIRCRQMDVLRSAESIAGLKPQPYRGEFQSGMRSFWRALPSRDVLAGVVMLIRGRETRDAGLWETVSVIQQMEADLIGDHFLHVASDLIEPYANEGAIVADVARLLNDGRAYIPVTVPWADVRRGEGEVAR